MCSKKYEEKVLFHVFAKPIGPVWNLNCSYCFYLHKDNLLSTYNNWRMSGEILEEFIKQYIQEQDESDAIGSSTITADENGKDETWSSLYYITRVVDVIRPVPVVDISIELKHASKALKSKASSSC